MSKTKLVGKTYYFNARWFGANGMLRGTVIEDGDESGNYPKHILLRGVYKHTDVWVNKSLLADKDTKEVSSGKLDR